MKRGEVEGSESSLRISVVPEIKMSNPTITHGRVTKRCGSGERMSNGRKKQRKREKERQREKERNVTENVYSSSNQK